jgi:cytochrome P450
MCEVVYLVCSNPEVKKKIQKEVDPLFETPTRKLQPDDLNKLAYLEAVIKEASRLFPQIPINFKTAEHDDEIGGVKFKVGFICTVFDVGLHNSSPLY